MVNIRWPQFGSLQRHNTHTFTHVHAAHTITHTHVHTCSRNTHNHTHSRTHAHAAHTLTHTQTRTHSRTQRNTTYVRWKGSLKGSFRETRPSPETSFWRKKKNDGFGFKNLNFKKVQRCDLLSLSLSLSRKLIIVSILKVSFNNFLPLFVGLQKNDDARKSDGDDFRLFL